MDEILRRCAPQNDDAVMILVMAKKTEANRVRLRFRGEIATRA
jgi:hypothetical protein